MRARASHGVVASDRIAFILTMRRTNRRAADHPAVADALVAAGFTDLTLQIGRGAYVPHRLGGGDGTGDAKGSSSGGGGEGAFVYEAVKGKARRRRKAGSTSLRVSFFRLAPSLAPLLEDADLVLSHAGAGSLFEALAAGCAVVAVPNPALMGDHQAELAERLASEDWLVACDIRGGGSALARAAADAASTAGGGARYDPMDARNIATRIMALA